MDGRTTTLRGLALLLGTTAIFSAGCGSKLTDSGAAGNNITISGTLNATRSIGGLYSDLGALGLLDNQSYLETVTDYTVRCVTLSGTPQSGEGTCDSAGHFSLSLASATNVPIGCFILKGGNIQAVVAFEGTTTGMDGQPIREGAYVAGDGANGLEFGTVTLDTSTGKATVAKSGVHQTGGSTPTTASGTWADVTGVWTIHDPGTVPSGYMPVCAAGSDPNTCHGPVDGQTVYFRQYHILDTSHGNADHYGMTLWDSQSAFTACGSAEGVGSLPSGWVAQTTSNTTASSLTGAISVNTTFPDPATVSLQDNTFCGNTNTAATNCSQISSNGSWGFNTAQCKFYCAMQGLWNGGTGCTGQFNVDWGGNTFFSTLSGMTPAYSGGAWSGIGSADTSHSDEVTYIGGTVHFRKQPKKRFMANELVISGSVGTLVDDEHDSYSICVGPTGTGCTSTETCGITRTNRLTITQTSANAARIDLVQTGVLNAGSGTHCAADSGVQSEIREQKMFFTISK